jgi:hypothetical protein
MSKVTSILDHPDHPSNKVRPGVVSRMKDKQAQRNKEMRDFLDSAYTASVPRYVKADADEFPDHLWEE